MGHRSSREDSESHGIGSVGSGRTDSESGNTRGPGYIASLVLKVSDFRSELRDHFQRAFMESKADFMAFRDYTINYYKQLNRGQKGKKIQAPGIAQTVMTWSANRFVIMDQVIQDLENRIKILEKHNFNVDIKRFNPNQDLGGNDGAGKVEPGECDKRGIDGDGGSGIEENKPEHQRPQHDNDGSEAENRDSLQAE